MNTMLLGYRDTVLDFFSVQSKIAARIAAITAADQVNNGYEI